MLSKMEFYEAFIQRVSMVNFNERNYCFVAGAISTGMAHYYHFLVGDKPWKLHTHRWSFFPGFCT